MRLHRALVAAGALLAVALLVRCLPVVSPKQTDWDVRGNYAVNHDERLTLKLEIGGLVREATARGYDQVVDFGTWEGQPLTLDLAAFCARPEVVCPSEALWKKVAIDVEDVSKVQNDHGLQVVNNEVRDLPQGQKAQTLAGRVSHHLEDRFVVGLGAQGGAGGSCAALGFSLAGGRFTHEKEGRQWYTTFRTPSGAACDPFDAGALHPDSGSELDPVDAGPADAGECLPYEFSRWEYPEGALVNGIAEGRIFMGWLGACAFGPVKEASLLTIETSFTGRRTGDFDPPPFAPAEPVLPSPYDAGRPEPRDAALAPPPGPDASSLDAAGEQPDAAAAGADAAPAEIADATGPEADAATTEADASAAEPSDAGSRD